LPASDNQIKNKKGKPATCPPSPSRARRAHRESARRPPPAAGQAPRGLARLQPELTGEREEGRREQRSVGQHGIARSPRPRRTAPRAPQAESSCRRAPPRPPADPPRPPHASVLMAAATPSWSRSGPPPHRAPARGRRRAPARQRPRPLPARAPAAPRGEREGEGESGEGLSQGRAHGSTAPRAASQQRLNSCRRCRAGRPSLQLPSSGALHRRIRRWEWATSAERHLCLRYVKIYTS